MKIVKKFSVIIPAYNEEKTVALVLNEIDRILSEFADKYEVIVVNDCSTDRSREQVLAAKTTVVILEHEYQKGYGAAIKTGIKNAKYEYILIIDSDGTYPNEGIKDLLQTLEDGNFDMVVGARIGENVKIPFIRKPAKWFINKLANYLSGIAIPDLNSGLRVMKKEIIEEYIHILPDGFSFTTTITLAMLSNGYSVKYIPIDYYQRTGKSKIKPVRDTLNFIHLIIRTVMYFNPLRIFVPLSLILVLFAFFVLFASMIFTGKAMDVTFGVILMTAVIVMVIGMLADLIDKRIR